MLEKELARATRMAEQANRQVEQLRRRLVAESEKTHVRLKRELGAARRQYTTANSRLRRARTALRGSATPANQEKVEALLKQVQELAASVTGITRSVYEAAEKLLVIKADAVLQERKAKAANQAAAVVEHALKRAGRGRQICACGQRRTARDMGMALWIPKRRAS